MLDSDNNSQSEIDSSNMIFETCLFIYKETLCTETSYQIYETAVIFGELFFASSVYLKHDSHITYNT